VDVTLDQRSFQKTLTFSGGGKKAATLAAFDAKKNVREAAATAGGHYACGPITTQCGSLPAEKSHTDECARKENRGREGRQALTAANLAGVEKKRKQVRNGTGQCVVRRKAIKPMQAKVLDKKRGTLGTRSDSGKVGK